MTKSGSYEVPPMPDGAAISASISAAVGMPGMAYPPGSADTGRAGSEWSQSESRVRIPVTTAMG